MGSGTSYFNTTLFCKNLARFWPIWGLYALIWVVLLPAGVLLRRDVWDKGNAWEFPLVLLDGSRGTVETEVTQARVAEFLREKEKEARKNKIAAEKAAARRLETVLPADKKSGGESVYKVFTAADAAAVKGEGDLESQKIG